MIPDDPPQDEAAFWQGIETCAAHLALRLTEPEARGFLYGVGAEDDGPVIRRAIEIRRRRAHKALTILVSVIRKDVLPVLRPAPGHRAKR